MFSGSYKNLLSLDQIVLSLFVNDFVRIRSRMLWYAFNCDQIACFAEWAFGYVVTGSFEHYFTDTFVFDDYAGVGDSRK